ncbi:MAG: WD40 repeat protein [Polaribacter sp.]|jgi:WD40 repeat protein
MASFSEDYSPDGKTILTGSVDKIAKLWSASSGNLIKKIEGHAVMVASVVFSPNGKYIVTGSKDSFAKLWDVKLE